MCYIQALCVAVVVGGTFASAVADARRGGRSQTLDELVGIVYGETSGLRPSWKDPRGPKNASNVDPESARQLHLARRWIAEVILNRGDRGGVADATYLTSRERRLPEALQAWGSCRAAAMYAWRPDTGSGDVMHYLLRKGGTAATGGTPRRPAWAKGHVPVRSFGPFRCVGGGDVPAGDNVWIDVFDDIPL